MAAVVLVCGKNRSDGDQQREHQDAALSMEPPVARVLRGARASRHTSPPGSRDS